MKFWEETQMGNYQNNLNKIQSKKKYFEEIIQSSPNHAFAHYYLGLIYEEEGKLEKAIEEYKTAIWGDTPCPSACRKLGVLYCSKTNMYQEALQYFEWARNMGDNSDELLFFLGLTHYYLDNYQAAEEKWQMLSLRYPEDKLLETNLAKIRYLKYSKPIFELDSDERVRIIEELKKLSKEHSEDYRIIHNLCILHHSLALKLEENRSIEKADYHWKEALSNWQNLWIQESYWKSLYRRGCMLGNSHFKENAVKNLRDNLPILILEINKDYAIKYRQNKELNEAKRHIRYIKNSGFPSEIIQTIQEKIAHGFLETAYLKASIGDFDEAITILEEYLEIDSDFEKAKNAIINILLKKGYMDLDKDKLKEARVSFNKVIQYDWTNRKALEAIRYINEYSLESHGALL